MARDTPSESEQAEIFGYPSSPTPDAAIDGAFWSTLQARLTRQGHASALWLLVRISGPSAPSPPRIFALPSRPDEQPPASLWIANLREQALASAWCGPLDIWAEPSRSGWANYGCNAIQELLPSAQGRISEGPRLADWSGYCSYAGLDPMLACSLPWAGLPAMWGSEFSAHWARREAAILRRALAHEEDGSSSQGKAGQRRPRKA